MVINKQTKQFVLLLLIFYYRSLSSEPRTVEGQLFFLSYKLVPEGSLSNTWIFSIRHITAFRGSGPYTALQL